MRRPDPSPVRWARSAARSSDGDVFLTASLLLHAAAVAALWAAGSWQLVQGVAVRDEALIAESIAQARTLQLQRSVRTLERLQRELTAQGPDPDAPLPQDPQALLARAQAAHEAVQTAERRARAEELKRLTGQDEKPMPAASAPAVAPAPAAVPAQDPTEAAAQQMAALERQAQQARDAAAERERRRSEGAAVSSSSRPRGAAGSEGGGAQAEGTPGTAAGQGSGSGRGAGQAGGALQGGSTSTDFRRYAAADAVSPAATAGTPVARGQRLGAGGPRADRIYLDTWYVAGPFPGSGPESLRRVHAPEIAVDLDAVYPGKDGRRVRWQRQATSHYPFVPQPRMENAVYYAWTEIRSDRAREVWIDIGADDDSMLWVNGERVWVSGPGTKPWYRQPFYTLDEPLRRYGLVEGSRKVVLRAGANTLLFKLYNGIDLMFFSVVVRPA
jgi:hypothetical protein